MAARDSLSGIQFRKAEESTPAERKRERGYGARGADNAESYGFSDTDPADYQYERTGKSKTETKQKRDVF